MASNMDSLLAKLRAKTANPAGTTPVIAPEKAFAEPIRQEEVPPKKPRESKLGYELQEKLANLEGMLLEKHPAMPTLLREIHTALRKQPENVILMSEEELHIIVNGLQKQTGVELTALAAKGSKTAAGKARAAKVSTDDLGF